MRKLAAKLRNKTREFFKAVPIVDCTYHAWNRDVQGLYCAKCFRRPYDLELTQIKYDGGRS